MFQTKIAGLGYYVPEKAISNDHLSQYMETSDQWIQERTGIKERRYAVKHEETTTTMGAVAAERAIEDAGIQSITSETPKAKEEFKVSEHVAFYIPGDIPAEWSYVSAVIEESEQGRFRVSFYHGDHMGSHGRSSVCCIDLAHGKKHRIHLDDHEIEMDIHKTEDQHFEVSIVLKGDD